MSEQNDQKAINDQNSIGEQNAKDAKSDFAKKEEQVLDFWQKSKIFEKSLLKPSPKGEYVFFDGPPFATGLPHYGHILAGTIKDVIPRYQTMRGYHVPRRWGWDCHGLPIENLIQEENNLKTKQDIENFGIKNFSKAAKNCVFRYDSEWRQIIPRTGRFVDMNNQYTTMDPSFMESVWWAFSTLHKKGLVYEGFRSMHISPLLETPLSNFEVNQNYKDITDISVFAKFKMLDKQGDIARGDSGETFLIAWTTTPWTLFGNVALAVGENIEYVKVKIINENNDKKIDQKTVENSSEKIILAKDRLQSILKDKKYEIIETFSGADLVGKKYEPIFDNYSKNSKLENHENGWKIYSADFVTTEDGSGIVHIAPAFGEDDLNLGKKHNLPFVQHVNIDGTIKKDISELSGHQAKPKATKENPNAHQETDILVLKMLAGKSRLFAKEKFVHSYPHCPRTDAPLLNYALSSWFVRVTDYNKKMVSLNKGVKWVPQNIGEKRFGNWLENIKDWGVSRSRYWGTPLPIWKSKDGSQVDVLGSVDDIKNRTKSTNKYFVMRHGEAEHNINKVLNSDNSHPANLTENGKRQIDEVISKIKSEKIDLIICSPLIRTRDTAKIISEKIGMSSDKIIEDKRLREIQSGILNNKSDQEFDNFFSSENDFLTKRPANGGENLLDVKKRMGDFIYDIDKKYSDKTILIISHDWPLWMLQSVSLGLDNKNIFKIANKDFLFIETGEFRHFDFAPIPHNDEYVLDLHRPYIDEITYEKDGKLMTRIPEVFDTWFDSGSMPYAVPHYPFEKNSSKKMNPGNGIFGFFGKNRKFPADFIAEGLDQTRGWFYTLLALNTALFGKSPYKNVVVNGLVLAEDGQKMSKRLKNYPEPSSLFNKYGADSMRYYMLSSAIVEAEPLSFSEKGVDEIYKKIIARLLNVLSFYEMYNETDESFRSPKSSESPRSPNHLDRWIIARLNQVLEQTTDGMEKYELNTACRPFFDFVDDLSTWYIRRSRDRFKSSDESDRNFAIATTKHVLNEFSKIIAPFMPFTAEMIYQKINNFDFSNSEKSVHLENWPKLQKIDENLIMQMSEVREFVSLALLARDKIGIKIRQPLQTLKINADQNKFDSGLIFLIKDEVNVKEVICDENLADEKVYLDPNISDELKQEGIVRELNRFIQSIRKNKKLLPNDKIVLNIETDSHGQNFIQKYEEEISESVRAEKITFSTSPSVPATPTIESSDNVLKIEKYSFKISIN
ncbi:MAG TPA: class I tRNA ligase family protein [Candidatus Paceibacterota bacterium]|nr:class I tRNA ligase family protein [Candidatus Paceibacterota bacterium]